MKEQLRKDYVRKQKSSSRETLGGTVSASTYCCSFSNRFRLSECTCAANTTANCSSFSMLPFQIIDYFCKLAKHELWSQRAITDIDNLQKSWSLPAHTHLITALADVAIVERSKSINVLLVSRLKSAAKWSLGTVSKRLTFLSIWAQNHIGERALSKAKTEALGCVKVFNSKMCLLQDDNADIPSFLSLRLASYTLTFIVKEKNWTVKQVFVEWLLPRMVDLATCHLWTLLFTPRLFRQTFRQNNRNSCFEEEWCCLWVCWPGQVGLLMSEQSKYTTHSVPSRDSRRQLSRTWVLEQVQTLKDRHFCHLLLRVWEWKKENEDANAGDNSRQDVWWKYLHTLTLEFVAAKLNMHWPNAGYFRLWWHFQHIYIF